MDAPIAGELIHHVHADHKYVLFEQSSRTVWKKIFLDLDRLEEIDSGEAREEIFRREVKEKMKEFMKEPSVKDKIVVEKELEIGVNKLKAIRDRQLVLAKHKQK